jgi:hypothetical protein
MGIGDERVVLLDKEVRVARNFATIDDEHAIFQTNLVNCEVVPVVWTDFPRR